MYNNYMQARRLVQFYLVLFSYCIFLPALAWASDANDQKQVRLYSELNSDDSYSFFADNDRIIPSYIHIEFTELLNYQADVDLPFDTVLPAGAQRIQLLTLRPQGPGMAHFAYSWLNMKGDPINLHPDTNFAYLFPFEHGKKFKLVQGFNGPFSHFGQNQYALDFNLPEGSPVYAARDGLVCDIKEDSNVGGVTPEYNDKANYIMIYHSDGTFGNYVHLKQNGALVKTGDQVKAGDLIGYSGNTGFSSGPHLHFDVRVPTRKGTMQSIPIQLLNYDGKPVVPQEGLYYYSLHPGQPPFTVELGRFLRNEDYIDWLSKPKVKDDVQIRTEQIDDTLILFVGNGTKLPIEGTVTLSLDNMTSSMGNPVKVKVPAQTEVFLSILNAVKPSRVYSYDANLSYINTQ